MQKQPSDGDVKSKETKTLITKIQVLDNTATR
jgi:hypothetical protein